MLCDYGSLHLFIRSAYIHLASLFSSQESERKRAVRAKWCKESLRGMSKIIIVKEGTYVLTRDARNQEMTNIV